jgi:hypothetical protein
MKVPGINPNMLVFAIWLAVCIALSGLLAWQSGMPFWNAVAIVAGVLLVNGFID